MNKLMSKINEMKNDKSNMKKLVKCFTINAKANELYVRNKTFNELKKVSR